MSTIFEYAKQLAECNLLPLPIIKGSKNPAIRWKEYQKRFPNPDEIKKWFENKDRINIALIAGRVSGNVECLDFDSPTIYDEFAARAVEWGIDGIVAKGTLQSTPSGGHHLVYRCENPVLTTSKLACDQNNKVLIETRGEGAYFLIDPSVGYKLIRGSFLSLPVITAQEREQLLELARSFQQHYAENKNATSANLVTGDFDALLSEAGWSKESQRGDDVSYWRRSGKTDNGCSASLGYVAPNVLYVFSTNAAPFDAGHAYNYFQAYALLKHDSNFGAAARALNVVMTGNTERPRIIYYARETSTKQLFSDLTSLLAALNHLYYYLGAITRIEQDKSTRIENKDQLNGLISEIADVFFISSYSQDGIPQGQYDLLSAKLASAYLNDKGELSKYKQVEIFTKCPIYDLSDKLVSPGYNVDSKIYYQGDVVTPMTTGHPILDTFLHDFCFQDKADRANYIAVLLSQLIKLRFPGKHPALAITGNQPGVGKSLLAQGVAIITQGVTAKTITYISDDVELEKRFGAVMKESEIIIIDNAKTTSRSQHLSSPILERSVTDPKVSTRELGHSRDIERVNTIQIIFTMNDAQFSPDLNSRIVNVRLSYEGNPSKRSFSNVNIEDYLQAHRAEIVAELVGIIENWKSAGMPKATIDCRFREWAEIIGGILQVSGIEGFLKNVSECRYEFDSDLQEIAVLAEKYPKQPRFSDGWVKAANEEKILGQRLANRTVRAQAVIMGNLLGRLVGEKLPVVVNDITTMVTLEKREKDKRAVYEFIPGVSHEEKGISGYLEKTEIPPRENAPDVDLQSEGVSRVSFSEGRSIGKNESDNNEDILQSAFIYRAPGSQIDTRDTPVDGNAMNINDNFQGISEKESYREIPLSDRDTPPSNNDSDDLKWEDE
jgi:hypothetical protein